MNRRTRNWLALSLAGAAGLHVMAAADHVDGGAGHGLFFLILAGMQFALAVSLTRNGRRSLVAAAMVVNLATAAVWALSRSAGLPGQAVEPVGAADLVATGLGLAAAGLAALLLRRPEPVARHQRLTWRGAGALATVLVAGSAFGASMPSGHAEHRGAGAVHAGAAAGHQHHDHLH